MSFSAYNPRISQLRVEQVEKMPATIKKDIIIFSKETTVTQKVLIQMLDNNCRHAFMNSLSRWNKYDTPIMLDEFMWCSNDE